MYNGFADAVALYPETRPAKRGARGSCGFWGGRLDLRVVGGKGYGNTGFTGTALRLHRYGLRVGCMRCGVWGCLGMWVTGLGTEV